MAVTHHADIREDFATLIKDAIEADPGAGNLIFKDDTATIATLVLDDDVTNGCGTVAAERLTFGPITDEDSASAGTIDNFIITTNLNTEILYGTVTVTGGGGDITLSSVNIDAGDTISMSSLYYDASL
jgi:hypothetical protein